jgi:transcriptional regulator with XRE-family HTH domain
MDEIGKEETALEAQIDELRGKIGGADSIGATVSSAKALLAELRKRFDAPVCWEQKRRLVKVLVAGVRQTRTTVTYRFSQPGEPMPLVLPQSYNTGRVIRIPTELNTVGDHIRLRRLGLKMLQREVAEQLGVCEPSVFTWEANTVSPEIRSMPAIIRFLGYNPLPAADTLGGRIVRHRTSLGMTREEAAKRLGVAPGTLARWERGEREPAGVLLERVRRSLNVHQDLRSRFRRVG